MNISIKKLSDKAQKNYNKVKELSGLTKIQDIFEYLLQNYNPSGIVEGELSLPLLGIVDNGESKEVLEAIKHNNDNLKQIVHDGVLQRSRYINSISKNQEKLSKLSDKELKQKTILGTANQRILNTIETFQKYNEMQESDDTRLIVTESLIFKVSGSNRQSIRKFFKDFPEIIEKVNKYDLSHDNKIFVPDESNPDVKIRANVVDLIKDFKDAE